MGSEAAPNDRRTISRHSHQGARGANQRTYAELRRHFGPALDRAVDVDQTERAFARNQSFEPRAQNRGNRSYGPCWVRCLAQQLGQLDSPIPNFILLDPCPEGNEFKEFKAGNMAGWLGAQYGPVRAGGDYGLPNVNRLADMTDADQSDREALRRFLHEEV